MGAGEQPEVLSLFLEILLPDSLDLNQVVDSFHQPPDVHLYLVRGFVFQDKAV